MTPELLAYLSTQPGRCKGCGFDLKAQSCHCPGSDWDIFTRALRESVKNGEVHQRDMRPKIRGCINPQNIPGLYAKAKRIGLITEIRRERSNDVIGRNGNKYEPVYSLAS